MSMKHTTLARVLLLVLAVVMVFSFASCASNKDLDAAKQELSDKIAQIEKNSATAAALKDLETIVDGVHTTAKAAATKADLDAAIAQIEALQAAAAVKTEVEATIAANKAAADSALAAAKTALEQAIADNATADAAALTAAKAALEKAIADNATDSTKALNDAKAALEKAIADNAAADAAALAAAKATLEATIQANDTAAKKAVADLKAELEAAIAGSSAADVAAATKALNEAKAALEQADADLDAAVTGLNKVVADNKTAADAAVAKVAKDLADNAKADEELAADVATLEAAKNTLTADVAALKTVAAGIDAKIAAAKKDLQDQIDAINANLAAIGGLDELAKTVAELEATIESMGDILFAKNFQAATEMLHGILKGENGEDYSLAAFKAAVEAVVVTNYAPSVYAKFDAEAKRIEFFLTRATSTAEIVNLFGQLDTAKAALITLEESLEIALDALGTITVDEDLTEVETIHAMMTSVPEELETRYENVKNAKQNLINATPVAEALVAAIDAQKTAGIIFLDSKAPVAALEARYEAFEADFFGNEVYTALYGEDTTAQIMITNYDELVAFGERLEVLDAAYLEILDIDALILNFKADGVLYTDLAAVKANSDAIAAWAAKDEFQLEAVNVARMYKEKYGNETTYPLVAETLAYATAMDALYTEYVNNAKYGNEADAILADAVAAFKAKLDAKTIVLSVDEAAVVAMRTAIDELATKIAALYIDAHITGAEGNYEAMVGALIVDFEAVEARVDTLNAAKTAFANELAAMNTIVEVDFATYTTIKAHRAALTGFFATYDIAVTFNADGDVTEGDANYDELAADAEARYMELKAAYVVLTEDIAATYNKAMALLDAFDAGITLDKGNILIEVLAELKEIIVVKKVQNVNLMLPSGDTEVNLIDLNDRFVQTAVEFDALAQAAVADAVAVNDEIANLDANGANLNDRPAIITAYDNLVAWYKAHIDENFDGDQAALLAGLDAVKAIEIFDENETVELYAFVTVENFEKIKALYNTSAATLAAADAADDAVAAGLEALLTGWNVHSGFEAADAAYKAFIDTYYDGAIASAEVDYFNLLGLYADFSAQKADWETKCATQDAAATVINDLIAELLVRYPGAVAMADGADVLAEIAAINALIDSYDATYCTDDCLFITDDVNALVDLYRLEARAKMAVEHKAVYDMVDADQNAVAKNLTLYNNLINVAARGVTDRVAAKAAIDGIVKAASSALAKYIPQ